MTLLISPTKIHKNTTNQNFTLCGQQYKKLRALSLSELDRKVVWYATMRAENKENKQLKLGDIAKTFSSQIQKGSIPKWTKNKN